MRVSPVHMNFNLKNRSNESTFKNSFNMNNTFNSSLNQNDVFIRLAVASTKDARIEKELLDMGLI